jgi:alkanesulfonate monooxygenase SsuD/methylene tetrahydromethanopterin reductase-like flavin-dependent oxidoreductase (luciferase family)
MPREPGGYIGGMRDLHLGIILPNYGEALDPEGLARVALAAEASGFDSAWVTDHVMVPDGEVARVYQRISEALVTLGFLVGRTRTLRLGTSALIVPLREPLLALKQLVSLDFLSGGRIVTVVAAGWLEPEFATLGARFAGRGRRLDEWLALVAGVLPQAPGPVRHTGGSRVEDAWLAPAPARPGGLELWGGGASPRALARAARLGVWHPVALRPEQLRPLVADLRARRPDARVVLRLAAYLTDRPDPKGTDERGRYALAGPPDWLAERLGDFVTLGVDGFVLNLDHQTPGLEDRVQRFAAEVAPLL